MPRLTITPQGNSFRVYDHDSKVARYVTKISGVTIHEDTRQLEMDTDYEFVDENTLVIK